MALLLRRSPPRWWRSVERAVVFRGRAFSATAATQTQTVEVPEKTQEQSSEPAVDSETRRWTARLVSMRSTSRARQLFEDMKKKKIPIDVGVYAGLMHRNAQIGATKNCLQAFAELEKAGLKPNVVVYNMLIKAGKNAGDLDFSNEWWKRLKDDPDVQPDLHSYTTMVSACTTMKKKEDGTPLPAERVTLAEELVEELKAAGLDANDKVITGAMLHLYGRAGMLDRARQLYDSAPASAKDAASLGALVSAYNKAGNFQESLKLFESAVEEAEAGGSAFEPNVALYGEVMAAYLEDKQYDKVEKLFNALRASEQKSKGFDEQWSSSSMASARSKVDLALMKTGVSPLVENARVAVLLCTAYIRRKATDKFKAAASNPKLKTKEFETLINEAYRSEQPDYALGIFRVSQSRGLLPVWSKNKQGDRVLDLRAYDEAVSVTALRHAVSKLLKNEAAPSRARADPPRRGRMRPWETKRPASKSLSVAFSPEVGDALRSHLDSWKAGQQSEEMRVPYSDATEQVDPATGGRFLEMTVETGSATNL